MLVSVAVCGLCPNSLSVSEFSAKIKSAYRISFSMGFAVFRFVFGKYASQRPQPRRRLLWFCLRLSVLNEIYFGLAVFFSYGLAVSGTIQCLFFFSV